MAKAKGSAKKKASTSAKGKKSIVGSAAKKKPSKKADPKTTSVPIDRRTSRKDRREDSDADSDRRTESEPVAVERRTLQRREKVVRRRQIDPTTCERDYSIEEVEFMQALDEYKRKSGRMFPTCSEILEVIRDLGYAKAGALPVAATPEPAIPLEFETDATLEIPSVATL